MRYVSARYRLYQREEIYRIYVSDALRMISESTAKFGGGEYVTARLIDIYEPAKRDERGADEIIADTINGAGIEVI